MKILILMGAFDDWASGLLDWEAIQEAIHYREKMATMNMPEEKKKERWDRIGYKPPMLKVNKDKQILLF